MVGTQMTSRKSIPMVRFRNGTGEPVDPKLLTAAVRTAFVARFIVLREGRRSKAHRLIEEMVWSDCTTVDELYARFRQAFIDNGDKLQPVDRDLRRALEHAKCSVGHFVTQYIGRSTLSFSQALEDYDRSNRLLFGDDQSEIPRSGGWRMQPRLSPQAEAQ